MRNYNFPLNYTVFTKLSSVSFHLGYSFLFVDKRGI